MDDISSAISSLLEDSEKLESLKSMVSSILPQNSNEEKSENIIPADTAKIISTVNMIKNGMKDNDSTKLLLSLRPYMSEDKKHKIDEAVKIMKLMSILPLLTENGLFG